MMMNKELDRDVDLRWTQECHWMQKIEADHQPMMMLLPDDHQHFDEGLWVWMMMLRVAMVMVVREATLMVLPTLVAHDSLIVVAVDDYDHYHYHGSQSQVLQQWPRTDQQPHS